MDPATQEAAKLTIEKLSDGGIQCLRFAGTIDEAFEGKKLASTVRADTLILDLGDVNKISSFGLREWTDFIKAVERNIKQIYIVECTPKVVDQLNMVKNFAGRGLVYSFYAPYRCDDCDTDRTVLFQVDRDEEAIKSMRPPERPCGTCGHPEYLDEDPASFFSYLATQPHFELSPLVAGFLETNLKYSVSDSPRRLQVEKHIEGQNTYLHLSGNLDGSFPREKISEGLEGTIVVDVSAIGSIDPAGAAEWRGFMAMTTPMVDHLYLLGCPPGFLERLTRPEDLSENVSVISFAMPYSCPKCATTSSRIVDLEEHYDIIKFATPPGMKCTDCKGAMTCVASESLLSHLPVLAQNKPSIDSKLRKFIKEAQQRKPAKAIKKEARAPEGMSRGVLLALVGMPVLALAAVALMLVYLDHNRQNAAATAQAGTDNGDTVRAERPEWITSILPASAYCTTQVNRVICVGVSSFCDELAAGRIEATNAALEYMTLALSLKIEDEAFTKQVIPAFAKTREAALTALDNARDDPKSKAFDAALDVVRNGRARVAAALRQTGGVAVPATATADWWEEYKKQDAPDETEFKVWVRFDLSNDAIKLLVDRYTKATAAAGVEAITAFPALAWSHPTVTGGAFVLTTDDGRAAKLGLSPGDVVTAAGDTPIVTAADLAAALTGANAPAKVTVAKPAPAPAAAPDDSAKASDDKTASGDSKKAADDSAASDDPEAGNGKP
ncbi:MAG TPA: hypothetical protein VFG83_12775 [Kofleriaceae bacterium]|nr:hypothetical protein [Kofleriaceae bacterium]